MEKKLQRYLAYDIFWQLQVWALITFIVGLYGHYSSDWVKKVSNLVDIRPYETCKINGLSSCPSISMERFFVAMIIICFLWSIVSLALDIVMQEKTQLIKYIVRTICLKTSLERA